MNAIRKINDFSKRARSVLVHARIINRIVELSPSAFKLSKINANGFYACYESQRDRPALDYSKDIIKPLLSIFLKQCIDPRTITSSEKVLRKLRIKPETTGP